MICTEEEDPPLLHAEVPTAETTNAASVKHIRNLRTVMFQLRAQDGLTDTVLICNGNVRVPAHQALLVATSPVLREKVAAGGGTSARSKPLKISLPDLEASTAEVLLEFIYTGRLNLPSRNHHAVGAALVAAFKLRVDTLYRRCSTVLASVLTLTNVMDVWALAEKCQDNYLKQQCVILLARQLESKHRTTRYLVLSLEQFRTILTAAAKLPNYESDRLLHATLAWVNHDRRSRSDQLGNLLACFGMENDPEYLASTTPSPPKTPPIESKTFNSVAGSGGGDDATQNNGDDAESDKDEPSFAGDISRNSSPTRSLAGELESNSPTKEGASKLSPSKGIATKISPKKGSANKTSPTKDSTIGLPPSKGTATQPKPSTETNANALPKKASPSKEPRKKLGSPLKELFGSKSVDSFSLLSNKSGDEEETSSAPVLVLISTKGVDRVVLEYLALRSDQWAARDVSLNLTINLGAAVAAFNDILYFFGGSNKSEEKVAMGTALDVPHLRSYPTAPMRVAKAGAVAAVLGQQIYCVGGESKYGKALSHVERYCPRADAWRILAPLRKARREVAATSAGDRLLVVGGNDGNTWLPFTEIYDPAVNEWTELTGFGPGPYCRVVATETDGRVYVFRCQKTRGTLHFDPSTNAWSPAAPDSGHAPASIMSAQAYGEQVYAVDDRRRVFVYYVHSGFWERLEAPSEWVRGSDASFVHAAVLSKLPESLNRPNPADHY